MRTGPIILIITTLLLSASCSNEQTGWIRINQLGYRPQDIKVAVYMSKKLSDIQSFKVINAETGDVVITSNSLIKTSPLDQFVSCYRLPFSEITKSGTYRIVAGRVISPDFRIDKDVYKGTADFLLNYMRQQRCGYNPYVKDSCHTHDGYKIYGNP